MFESAALEHKFDKKIDKAELPGRREDLLNARFDLLAAAAFPGSFVIAG